MNVKHNGKAYTLNVDKAIALGVLVSPLPLRSGDVYKNRDCRQLLVECSYRSEYQLLGIGLSCNSDNFFMMTHSLMEIETYLLLHNYKFVKNIDKEVSALKEND